MVAVRGGGCKLSDPLTSGKLCLPFGSQRFYFLTLVVVFSWGEFRTEEKIPTSKISFI